MQKYFIITIDTEADNQWNNNQACTTKNSKYLPRFQELAEKYNFKPVWLTTYEMANDNFFVNYFKDKCNKGLCEIGMHLHAWNNPPEYNLVNKTNERSYLIEYPKNIMEQKIKVLDELLTKKIGIKPVSHRAGRWTTNEDYFELLEKYGYKVDCSVTPHISWENHLGQSGIKGSNYSNSPENPYFIKNKLLEVPVTIRIMHNIQFDQIKNIRNAAGELFHFLKGRTEWVRPNKNMNKKGILKLIKKCNKHNDYIMFMLHSSELMPNGSPNFSTYESVEHLYTLIEEIFRYISNLGYTGITLNEFYEKVK